MNEFPRLKRNRLMDFTMLYDAHGEAIGWEREGVIWIFDDYEYGYEFYKKAMSKDLDVRLTKRPSHAQEFIS